MAELDIERLILPGLLLLLVLGALFIFATNGNGGTEPASSSAPAAKSSSVGSGKGARSKRRSVKVRQGDTPTSIADAAGIPLSRLLELNPRLDPASLRPGQTLKLAP